MPNNYKETSLNIDTSFNPISSVRIRKVGVNSCCTLPVLLSPQAAQTRREEKKRMEKEKMMLEEDPEKTRKWEVRPQRAPTEREGGREGGWRRTTCPRR